MGVVIEFLRTLMHGDKDHSGGQPSYSFSTAKSPPDGTLGTSHATSPLMSEFDFNFQHSYGGSGSLGSPSSMSFKEPFVPQAMWNLNQTFEWDWANLGFGNM